MYQMVRHGEGGVCESCSVWCLFQPAPLLQRPMVPSGCLQVGAASPHMMLICGLKLKLDDRAQL